MRKFLLKMWIKFKCKHLKRMGKELLELEQLFLENYNIHTFNWRNLQETHDLEFKSDKLLGFIPWDRQYCVPEMFGNKGGDCNSIHRIAQVTGSKTDNFKQSLLVTYWAKPFNKSHTFCIKENHKGQFIGIDYDYMYICDSFEKVLNSVTKHYNVECKAYICQNLLWEIIECQE